MADVKVSGLAAVAAVAGANEFLVNEAGTSKKASATQIKTFAQVGTTTNDDAAAGSIGEYVSSTLAQASATSLTTQTAKTVTSISLTAGDWDVDGVVNFIFGLTTNAIALYGGISTTNNTLGANNTFAGVTNDSSGVVYGNVLQVRNMVPHQRISISGTTTVYLIAYADFTVSTTTVHGLIRARRVR